MTDNKPSMNSGAPGGSNSNGGANNVSSGGSNTPARKRRRWPIVVGIVLLLLVLLVLAIPSMMCTGPGVRFVESQINSRISGSVAIGRMSLGWFTPAKLNRVTLKDPNGDVVVGDVNIVTHRSILNLLTNWHNVGNIAIDIKTLTLSRDSNHQLNIMQALANPHPAAASPASTQAAVPQTTQSGGTATALPQINATLTLNLAQASFTSPGLEPFHADHTNLIVAVNTLDNKPIKVQLDTAAGLVNQARSKIHVAAEINAIANGQIMPVANMTGTVTAGIQKLNLAALAPVLSMAGVKVSPSGDLTLALAAKIPAPGTGSVVGHILVKNAALSGAMLKGDSPQLGTVQVPINASWQADDYQISALGIETALGGAAVTGHGSIATVLAVLRHKNVSDKLAVFNITASAPLAQTLTALPHVIALPSGLHFVGGQTTVTAAISLGHSGPAIAQRLSGTLPPVNSGVQFAIRPLHWTQANGAPNDSAAVNGTVAFNTLGKPVKADIHLHIVQAQAKPADFSLVANLTAIKNGEILPLNQLTGKLKLLVSNLDLTAISQILPRTSRSIVFHGVVNGKISVNAPEAGSGEISGPLAITNCALGGTLLKGDQPQVGTVTLPLNISWKGKRFHIGSVGLKSNNLRMLVSGDATLAELKAIQNNQADWGASDLHVSSYCNLGWFTSSFRHTLGLGKLALRLRHGMMNLRADLINKGTQSTGRETLSLTDLRGTWKKAPFIINPVLVGANFQRSGTQWNLLKGMLDQAATVNGKPESTPQLNVLVTGQNHGAYALSLQAVLANLVQEAAPFVALNGRSVAGTLDINATAADILAQKIPYHLSVAVNGLSVGLGQGRPVITEPAVNIHSDGTLLSPHGAITGVNSTLAIQSAEINIPSGNLEAQKLAAGWTVPQAQINISSINLPAVMKMAAMFSPSLAHDDIGGAVSHSVIAAAYKPGSVTISKLHLEMDKISFRNTAPKASAAQFVEPKLTVDMACQALMGKATKVKISSLAINTSDGAVDLSVPKPMTLQTGGSMTATIPAFAIDANLGRFVPLLEALGKLQAGSKLQGALALKGAVSASGSGTPPSSSISFTIGGGVKNYQLTIPGSSAKLPPDNLVLAVSGLLNPAVTTFTCLNTCTVGEHAVTGSGGNTIELNKGSVIAWSDKSPENVSGAISYNLARIQALLGPMLPAGLVMSGKHTMNLHITGQLTADKGLRELRKLEIAQTSLGFDKIAIDGLTLGPGKIPFVQAGGILRLIPSAIPANNGTLNTGGHIDFNLASPEYILTSPLSLVNQVQINEDMGGSLLNFLPLAWGAGKNSAGVQLTGTVNVQLQKAALPLAYAQLKKTGTLTGTISATHITSDSPLFSLIGRSMGPLVSSGGSGLAMKDSGIRPTMFDLKNGKIYYQNLQILLVSFGMDFSGWVGLDQTVHQDVNVTGAGITLPIPLSIDGTTSKPQLHLSAKPLKNIGHDLGNTLKNAPNIINNFRGLFGH